MEQNKQPDQKSFFNDIILSMKTVVIMHNNKRFEISRKSLSNSNRYLDEFTGLDQIIVNDEYSDEQFGLFIRFLETGEFNTNSNYAYNIFSILNDWKCNCFVIKDFKSQMLMKENDFFIIHNEKKYPTSLGLIIMASQVIKDHFLNTSSFCFEIPNDFSTQCVVCLLDLIHNRYTRPVIDMYSEVRELAEFLDCQSIRQVFVSENNENLVANLRKIQNTESVDTNDIEELISSQINDYIITPEFAKLSIPSLIRILSQSNGSIKVSSITNFIECAIEVHGASASILIHYILFSISEEEITDFLEILSSQRKMPIFQIVHDYIIKLKINKEKQKEIDSQEIANLKRQIQILLSKQKTEIAGMKSEHEKQIKSLNSKHEEEMQSKLNEIKILKNTIRDNESKASEFANKIQGKDKEIMRLTIELDSNNVEKCTYVKTKRDYVDQHWFHCRTCGLIGSNGCCHVCAKNCHSGHDVYYDRFCRGCFCDCAESGKCRCLK